MADYSAIPSDLPDTSFHAFISGNSNTPDKKPEKKDTSGAANWTKENAANVDKALEKHQEGEKERETTPLPTPPKMEEAPKPESYQTDPMQKFGSAGSLLAVFGSMLTRKPLTNALNGAAAVNTAINEGDASKFKSAFDKWKIDNENSWKMADWQQSHYNDIMKRIDAKEKGAEEELKLAAIKFNDPTLEHAIQVGDYRQHLQMIEKNSNELKDHAEKAQIEAGYKNDGIQAYKAAHGGQMPQGGELSKILQDAREKAETGSGGDFEKKQSSVDSKKAYDEAYSKELKTSGDENKARLAGATAAGNVENAFKGKSQKAELTDEIYEQKYANSNEIAGLAKAYSEGVPITQLVPGWSKDNLKREAVLKKAYDDNPGMDWEQAHLTYLNKVREQGAFATRSAPAKIAIKEMDNLAGPMVSAVKQLDLGEYPDLNALENAYQKKTGGPEVVAAALAVQEFKTAFTNLMVRNGVATDQARGRADDLINVNMPLNQIQAVVNQAKISGGAVIDAIQEAQGSAAGGKSKSGEAPDGTVITDAKGNTHTKTGGKWNPPLPQ